MLNNTTLYFTNTSDASIKGQGTPFARPARKGLKVLLLVLVALLGMPGVAIGQLIEYRMDEAGWIGANTILDNSGNNRHGTPVGGAAPDDADPARDTNPGTCSYGTFDGTDDGVEDSDAGAYLENGLIEVTVTAWVYNAAPLSGNNRGIFFTGDPSPDKDHRLGIRFDASGANGGGSNLIKAGVQTTECPDGSDCVQVETQSNVMKQGTWQHVAMTWKSGGDLRVYVDGTDVTGDGTGDIGQGTGGTLDAINGLRIAQGGKGERWQGRIDEFRIYERALTASEVQGVFLEKHPCSTADLQVTKTVDDATPNVGDVVTFTVTLINNGPDDATGVSVEDTLPAGYGSVTNISNSGSLSGNVITWSGLSINNGNILNLSFDAEVLAP